MALTEIPSELSSTPSIVDNGDATAITIGTDESVTFNSTLAVALPVGTTAQRPTGAAGQFRYNSTLSQFEGYTSAWGEIGGGSVDGITINPLDVQIGAGYTLMRSSSNSGHLEGTYDNVGDNALHSNPIYTIGSTYNPALTTLGNMYGIGYTTSAASFISGMGTASGNWGQYVAADGDARIFLDATAGSVHSSGNVRAYGYEGHANVAGTGNASYHPSGIYSTGGNWFYGTQYNNGNDTYFQGGSIRSIHDIVSDQNHGYGLVGLYSASVYQHVWSMGAAYRLPANGVSSAGSGNLYGLAFSYNPNYAYSGSNAQSKAGLNHQLLLMMNGTTHTALGAGIWTSGNVTAYSDRRVKTNIERIPDAVSKVKQLSGYVFDRTDVEEDPATGETNPVRQTGVIAQEVLAVLPEAVMGSDEEGYSVAYGNMVGLLIEAIKEQQDQIENLKLEIQTLKEAS